MFIRDLMADRLKDLFLTRESLGTFARAIRDAHPPFDVERFLRLVFDESWTSRELKDRMHHVTAALGATLPPSYPEALEILKQAVPAVRGFEAMVCPDFVETYGLDDPERSLPALGYFTRFGSAEFAIRPFLDRDPEKAMAYMQVWAGDADPSVRRLASEGCRPRLPWAMALPRFKRDPSPILPILERLKDDDSEDVRRSVANNLNDIAKDNPGLVLDLCERWMGRGRGTDALLKHACRTLLKNGNARAMRLFGYGAAAPATVRGFRITPRIVPIGGSVRIGFALTMKGRSRSTVRLEYRVGYVKAKGRVSQKVFQIAEKAYGPGTTVVEKRHACADLSTRKHYPGRHTVTLLLNGRPVAKGTFVLKAARRAR